MSRNHLHGALIALFPILVSIATGFIVSATRSAPPIYAIVICLLILTAAVRMGGQKQAEPALSPREQRESRRRARSR
jgi:protein-S-isoprenylcysteine O-methyltransferase Ste14